VSTTVASGADYTSTSTKTSMFDVLRSELTKLRTVRSTYWSFLVTLVLVAGLSILIASAVVSRWDQRPPRERIGFDPTALGLAGVFLGQLAIGVLGVLVITSEYSTGSIRVSLAAVPQRLRMFFAKVGVFSLVTVVVGVVSCFVAFLGSQSLFATKNAAAHLGDPGVTRAVLGAALYLTLVGLLGLGIGGILRRTPAAISILVGLLLVVPILVGFLPQSWQAPLARYLPGAAGQSMFAVRHASDSLSPGKGLLVMLIWVVVSLGGAAVLLVRRDA
jgi:ABC-2 type transport system permease protein